MTNEEQIAELLDTIALDIENRCDLSVQGVRHLCLLVGRNLTRIDLLLLELDYREKEVK